ncbi:hypothetical protein [Saccharopolyspora taberi]|uniref:DUF4245 domain-containing protein n=1 Tax=Saccharopolyspora taberi TaxID=60895 RepID=A0ABN3VFC8_9PSEU
MLPQARSGKVRTKGAALFVVLLVAVVLVVPLLVDRQLPAEGSTVSRDGVHELMVSPEDWKARLRLPAGWVLDPDVLERNKVSATHGDEKVTVILNQDVEDRAVYFDREIRRLSFEEWTDRLTGTGPIATPTGFSGKRGVLGEGSSRTEVAVVGRDSVALSVQAKGAHARQLLEDVVGSVEVYR